MPYSRRDVLKDGALIAAAGISAGVAGYSILGCKSKPAPVVTRPSYFLPGVRIFFEGTWLFCIDPTDASKQTMRAITLEISAENHYFRYGPWDPSWTSGTDSTLPQLPLYHYGDTPPAVIVSGFSSPKDMKTVFTEALTNSPFTYIPPKDGESHDLNWQAGSLRMVSMPVPTRIIPAGYNAQASITDVKGHLQKHPKTCKEIGVATTHIFEYQGAKSLDFSVKGMGPCHVGEAQDYKGDFHFHTVPKSISIGSHAREMFDALLQLIPAFPHNDVYLTDAPMGSPIEIGPDVPNCVLPEELEIFSGDPNSKRGSASLPTNPFQPVILHGNFATCGSGAVGVA